MKTTETGTVAHLQLTDEISDALRLDDHEYGDLPFDIDVYRSADGILQGVYIEQMHFGCYVMAQNVKPLADAIKLVCTGGVQKIVLPEPSGIGDRGERLALSRFNVTLTVERRIGEGYPEGGEVWVFEDEGVDEDGSICVFDSRAEALKDFLYVL